MFILSLPIYVRKLPSSGYFVYADSYKEKQQLGSNFLLCEGHSTVYISCHRVSVRPSVCLSQFGSCTKMAKPRITLTTPCNSPETVVFWRQKSPWNSNQITPTGRQIEVGQVHIGAFWPISRYISETVQDRDIVTMLIGTRKRSIEWCYFQWPWVTPNHPIFRFATPFIFP